MESIEDRTPAYKSPIILAGCFCLIAGMVLTIWSIAGLIMLGGSVLFGVIAGVLGYQRQSVVLILFPLIIGVAILVLVESELLKYVRSITEDFQSFEKSLPKISVPDSQKFDR
jgi:hypothetical protein